MGKKMHISHPVSLKSTHPKTRLIELALAMVQDIKDNKVDTIQHGKAGQAMVTLDNAVNDCVTWANQHNDNAEVNQVLSQITELLLEKAGPETELGQWLNQDRNSTASYRSLMTSLNVAVAPGPKTRFVDRVLPSRAVKGIERFLERRHQAPGDGFNDFKQKAAEGKEHGSSRTSDTDSIDSDESSSGSKPKF